MPFFENATNFTISGGTFNTISGDLNRYERYHSTATTNSFNNQDNIPSHPYYPPYGSRPPRGIHHQERGPFGYADYYDDNPRPAPEADYGRYDDQGRWGHLETSMHSPGHVEITGGDFNTARSRNQDQRDSRYFTHEPQGICSPSSSCYLCSTLIQLDPRPPTTGVDPSFDGGNGEDEENTVSPEDDSAAMIVEDTVPRPSDPDPTVPSPDLPPPRAQRPLTHVEKMRMAMADMELSESEATQGVDTPIQGSSSERKRKSIFSRKNLRT
ncbi:hypothetical protein B0H11DRAFT_1987575 [Mycena galericulata]|nr:hypothetical protein B0H11DRAFT_1987575 [Mycena galericulata]